MKKILLVANLLLASLLAKTQEPAFVWAKQIGGSLGTAVGTSIVTDETGNVYTAGYFGGTVDFDPGVATSIMTSYGNGGYQDIFISKLDAKGNFAWAKKFGSYYTDIGKTIALDGAGNIIITGEFQGIVDFDPGADTFNLLSGGSSLQNTDAFILKLDASGNFIWATNFGVSGNLQGWSLAIDPSDNVYTLGIQNLPFIDGIILISKLDASGNFVWKKEIMGQLNSIGISIVADKEGNIFVTGQFQGTVDFNPGAGTFNLTSNGNVDIFILKLDKSGDFVWAKKIGGSQWDYGTSITLDSTGNIYVTGGFESTVDFDPDAGSYELSSEKYSLFILKLNKEGGFIWTKAFGGPLGANGSSIKLDAYGNIYVSGMYNGVIDFLSRSSMKYSLVSNGSNDIFILKLNANADYAWAVGIGGPSYDQGSSIAIDRNGNLYATGNFNNTVDFDPGSATFHMTSVTTDVFILKIIADFLTIEIFPNPTNGVFQIKLPNPTNNIQFAVFDTDGRQVLSQTSPSKLNTIDLSSQPNGIYFIAIIYDKNKIVTRKIVKTD